MYRRALPEMLTAVDDDGHHLLDLDELRGRDLVCWCHDWDGKGPNPRYCHADVLLEMANPPAEMPA